jgi:hypothetical protein
LETIRVGTGERNAARSAGFVRANSRLLKNPVIVVLPWLSAYRRVNATTDFSKCSSLIRSAIFARAAPGVNSTTLAVLRRRKAGDLTRGRRATIAIS